MIFSNGLLIKRTAAVQNSQHGLHDAHTELHSISIAVCSYSLLRIAYSGLFKSHLTLHVNLTCYYKCQGGTRWRSWLRHCSTRRKAAGSITDGVIGIFHLT